MTKLNSAWHQIPLWNSVATVIVSSNKRLRKKRAGFAESKESGDISTVNEIVRPEAGNLQLCVQQAMSLAE